MAPKANVLQCGPNEQAQEQIDNLGRVRMLCAAVATSTTLLLNPATAQEVKGVRFNRADAERTCLIQTKSELKGLGTTYEVAIKDPGMKKDIDDMLKTCVSTAEKKVERDHLAIENNNLAAERRDLALQKSFADRMNLLYNELNPLITKENFGRNVPKIGSILAQMERIIVETKAALPQWDISGYENQIKQIRGEMLKYKV